LLLGATARGICFLGFAEPAEALLAELRRRFPRARVEDPVPGALAGPLGAVLVFLEDPCTTPALPLDLQGTPFQLRVWEAMVAIPPGETRTYAALAATIGAPSTAARAVGRASALNPVSLLVPCHRMVGGEGGLRGYRWGGVAVKRALQALEAAAVVQRAAAAAGAVR
jgi:AraC family transcriptional regulator, regulatory protein of adaptative response / methylated-DNA-[protein]-cysteine methyltransferase